MVSSRGRKGTPAVNESLVWAADATKRPLSISADGATLSWDVASAGMRPACLGSEAKARLECGQFRWELEIELKGHQIGVGILISPPDWGVFGYLGAGRNAWAYDAYEGAIVTETVAIHSNLPRFTGSGIITVDLDLLANHTCTFAVNGAATPPIALPPDSTVIPAACFLAVGQRARLRRFEILRRGAATLDDANAARARFGAAAAAIRERLWQHGPGRREAAERELERIQAELVASPDNLGLLRQACALSVGSSRDAILVDIWQRITQLVPDDWEAWRWRAFYLGRLERHEEQLACWEQLITNLPDSDPNAPRASPPRAYPGEEMEARKIGGLAYFWSAKARCLANLGRVEEAVACFARATALAPQHPSLLKDMGDVLLRCERWTEAETLYQQVLARQPRFVHARLQRAICLARLGRYDEAITEADRAVNHTMLGPRELGAYLRYKMGNGDGAERVMEEHMREHPHFHPLLGDRDRVCGFEVDDGYRALADRVFERFAHLRRKE
jgi:tetratricopeptide (TPR) repeat protein